ncbi:hypothetical protein LSH36_351g00008 [Paralvinella palmiformis]|uniref:Uncharacterized protein n=1 Tax=Paralvinella palmiformis TaxID=53620 RepID=A0AAD9N2F9_9ANNE|nr:hypothetical protein LSH36_351g00008 [Paralvinella palmiformis]
MTTYGLPRQVITFLRHLEVYREFLRWEISEGSHKVTLTLCWNFRKRRGIHESLWSRLQRTLHLNQSPNDSVIPRDLSHLLVTSPRSSHKTSSSSTFGRRFNWARLSSLSLPARWRHQQSSGGAKNSLRDSTPEPGCLHPVSPSRLSLPVSPSRYSWHGTVQASTPSDTMDTARASTPVTSTPDSIRSSSISPSHVGISCHREDDISRSPEDLVRNSPGENQDELHGGNRDELEKAETGWNETAKNWSELVASSEPSTSSEPMDIPEDKINLDRVNDTVQKCLQTCDSILDKHSTLIL